MRLQDIQRELQDRNCVLALSPGDDFRYAVGWSPLYDERLTFLLIGPQQTRLVIPSVNAEEAIAHLGDSVPVERFSDDLGPRQALERAVTVVGRGAWLVSDDARYDHASILANAVAKPLGLASDVMAAMRMQKSEEECQRLEECQRINDQAMLAGYEALRLGITELELADVIRRAFLQHGADSEAFIIVAFGDHTALPHHHPTDRPLTEGPVLLDIGCYYKGYASDMTRVAYFGEPSEKYRQIHAIVDQAVGAAQAQACPGASAELVDGAARQIIAQEGYGEAFVHRVGHGIGLSVHEPPSVMQGNHLALPENAAFSIEPGIYLPGEFGVRLEEVVINRAPGAEILSKVPRAIHVVHP